MTHAQTAVSDDIIEHIAADSEVTEAELELNLTRPGGPDNDYEDLVSRCYELQAIRNKLEPEITEAAAHDKYTLVDSDGYKFWVDSYDGFGAHIHQDDGDTHYVSLTQLQSFTIEATD